MTPKEHLEKTEKEFDEKFPRDVYFESTSDFGNFQEAAKEVKEFIFQALTSQTSLIKEWAEEKERKTFINLETDNLSEISENCGYNQALQDLINFLDS